MYVVIYMFPLGHSFNFEDSGLKHILSKLATSSSMIGAAFPRGRQPGAKFAPKSMKNTYDIIKNSSSIGNQHNYLTQAISYYFLILNIYI